MSLEAAAADVVRRTLDAAPTLGGGRLVCIDGPAGAGKTTFADAVRDALPDPVTRSVLHMDDVYPGWSGLAAGVDRVARQVVAPLSRDEPGRYRRYDWLAGREAEWHVVPPVDVLVVEGVGSAALDYAEHITTLVWMDAPRELGVERAMARDVRLYGVEAGTDQQRATWARWTSDEDALFAAHRTRERADLVVAGTT